MLPINFIYHDLDISIVVLEKIPPASNESALNEAKSLLNVSQNIQKTPKGSPYIDPKSSVSISHSKIHYALAVGHQPIGLDIETYRFDQLYRVKKKILNQNEMEFYNGLSTFNQSNYLQIVWGIKEALYKATQGQFWNFINHYHVTDFDFQNEHKILCSVNDLPFYAKFRLTQAYCLVWVVKPEPQPKMDQP